MLNINCSRTIRAMENDPITLQFEIKIGREMAERAKEIFTSYGLTIENGIVCMIKRTFEFDDIPFFELLPDEAQEIDF